MRWLSGFLSLSLLATGSLAAKSSPEERFKEFHTKALSSAAVKLVDATYRSLTTGSRDYTAAVLLTALEARFGCQLCREFQPEWDLLAKSWTKGDKAGESRVVFGTLGLLRRQRCLHVSRSANCSGSFFSSNPPPALTLLPPRSLFDTTFTAGHQSAEQVHHWLTRHLPDRPHPPVKRPINYMRWGSAIIMVLGLGTLAVTATPYVWPIIQSRNLWAAISLIAILLFTSGHMFNHIRKAPYVAGDGKGGNSYFAAGFQNQYGLETQIVAAIYGILSFCTISLAIKVPRIRDPQVAGAWPSSPGAAPCW